MLLRDTIDELCLARIGRKPDLGNPAGFNDLIQWLKIYDQRKEHIAACDKWAVRKMVPKDHLIPARLGMAPSRLPCVMKCTHDCGSVRIVERSSDLVEAGVAMKECLARPYGVEKGEWAYQFVRPRIITEKLLEHGITDYKFHCSHGQIRWCQVIAERRSEEGPMETILSAEGQVLPLHMDQNMRHVPAGAYPGVEAWRALTKLAKKLSKPWRYVRVDLYWSGGQAWFGELTFWPLAGCYLTEDEPAFGKMLELDLSKKLKPIVS
jgi:hypothetical protein